MFLYGETAAVWEPPYTKSYATTCFWGGDPSHLLPETKMTPRDTETVKKAGVDGAAPGRSILDGEADTFSTKEPAVVVDGPLAIPYWVPDARCNL